MTTTEKQKKLYDKILYGLEKSYDKLIKSKKQSNSEIVIIKGNKIVRINPE